MMTDEKIEELLSVLRRLEKSGTFSRFFDSISGERAEKDLINDPFKVDTRLSYEENLDRRLLLQAGYMDDIYKAIARTKAMLKEPLSTYNYYKSLGNGLKNPELIKFAESGDKYFESSTKGV